MRDLLFSADLKATDDHRSLTPPPYLPLGHYCSISPPPSSQYLHPSGQIPAIESGPHGVIATDVTWRAGCDISPVGANIMSNNSPSLDKIQKRHSMGAFIPFSYPGYHSSLLVFRSLRVWLGKSGSIAFSSLVRSWAYFPNGTTFMGPAELLASKGVSEEFVSF